MSDTILTKHENESFKSQTVMLSGHGYINCQFSACTLIVTNSPLVVDGCRFENCNLRLEYDVLWGDPSTRRNLQELLESFPGTGTGNLSTDAH